MINLRTAGKYVILVLLIGGSFFLNSCAQETVPETSPVMAVIEGKVLDGENDTFVPVPGASVVITRIHSNGLVENVTTSKAYTDKSGYFKIQTEAFDEPHLVIVAKNYDKIWKTTLIDPLEPESNVSNVVLNAESTVETEIFNRLKIVGKHSAVSFNDIEQTVTIDNARTLIDNAVEIAKMAESILHRVRNNLDINLSKYEDKSLEISARQNDQTPSDNVYPAIYTQSSNNTLVGQQDDPRIFLQVSGDVPLTDNAREILDIFARRFGTVHGNKELKIVAKKTRIATRVNEEISGSLSVSQRELIQQLKYRMHNDFEEIDRVGIRLEIRVFLYQPDSKNTVV
mgnify:FL=1